MANLARRFETNPILRPSDVKPSREGLEVECLLNPGVFRWQGKTWLLLRVAERPRQAEGRISTPILDPYAPGGIAIVNYSLDDPEVVSQRPARVSVSGQKLFDHALASAAGVERRRHSFSGGGNADTGRAGGVGIVRHRRQPRDRD